jgi:hypothetical protein
LAHLAAEPAETTRPRNTLQRALAKPLLLKALFLGIFALSFIVAWENKYGPVCMNALEHLQELAGFMANYVHRTDMFLIQSLATCGALFWYVCVLLLPG